MVTAVACHFLSSISAWPALRESAVEDYTKFRREVFDAGVVDTGLKLQEGKGAIVYSDITEKDAAEFGLSVDTIRRLARSHCRFMEGG
jgi:hypothetical protein